MSDLERRVRDLEERLSRLTNPSEAWLRKMADAEDQAGSVSAGGLACDVNADLMEGFSELQRKLDAGEAIVSTSGKVLVKKRPVVNPCRKCGGNPRIIGSVDASLDSGDDYIEISCCTQMHGGKRDWTVRHWNKMNPAPEPEPAEQPLPEFATGTGAEPPLGTTAEQREWWVVISHLGNIVRHYRDHSFANRDVKKIPNCRIARVVLVPTREERDLAYANMAKKFGVSPADFMDEIIDSFFGPAES